MVTVKCSVTMSAARRNEGTLAHTKAALSLNDFKSAIRSQILQQAKANAKIQ